MSKLSDFLQTAETTTLTDGLFKHKAVAVSLLDWLDIVEEIKQLEYKAEDSEILSNRIENMTSCNTCLKRLGCKYVPELGEDTRLNCPLWESGKNA